jgi:hypothetical protein
MLPQMESPAGTPKAITVMAHKLARTISHLLKRRQAYDPTVWTAAEEELKAKRLKGLARSAATYGLKLVAASTLSPFEVERVTTILLTHSGSPSSPDRESWTTEKKANAGENSDYMENHVQRRRNCDESRVGVSKAWL